MIILRNKRLCILELSGSAVKLLLCPKNYTKDLNKFTYSRLQANINQGIFGGKMDIEYFSREVLPKIEEVTKDLVDQKDNIVCISTAWSRSINNLDEIQKLIPYKINVLSEKEEADLTLKGYINTAKRNLSNYSYILSIDSGSKSSDIKLLNGDCVSINRDDLRTGYYKLRSIFGWLVNEENVLIAITGKKVSEFTKELSQSGKHDQVLDINKLGWHKGLQSIFNIIGRDHVLVSNLATLSYGVFYNYIGR